MKRRSGGGRHAGWLGGSGRSLLGLASVVACSCLSVAALAADYSAKGAFTVSSQALSSPVAGQIAFPTSAPGSSPWVVIGHGQGAQATDQLGLAKHLASHGIIAVVPELCSPTPSACTPDPLKFAQSVSSLKTWITSVSSPVLGKVDVSKLGLVGHGTGGYVISTASGVSSAVTTVLLDPVAANPDTALSAMSALTVPVMSLYGGKTTCNKSGGWEPHGIATKPQALAATVVGANHCDADPEWVTCPLVCGASSDVARAARFRHYTTAWLLGALRGDAVARCDASQAAMTKDTQVSNVRSNYVTTCASGAGGGGGSGGAGAGGKAGASAQAGAGAGGFGAAGSTGGSVGQSGKAGSSPVAGSTGTGGGTVSGGAGNANKAGAPNPDDGRNEYFELDQLKQEGLGDAESAPACVASGREARAAGWLLPIGLALLLRARRRSSR